MEIKLGENITRLRKEQGLTQEQLAKLLNVTVGAVSKWETGNNRPDIELLPVLADILQVSIDALIGYKKTYKDLEHNLKEMNALLLLEKYQEVTELGFEYLKRYPNDFQLNKLLADSYYSQCFSNDVCQEKREQAIYFYERCIELHDRKNEPNVTEEMLYIQIATLCVWDNQKTARAMEIIEKYNGTGKYNNLLATCLLQMGKKEEARKLVLHHSVANQIFCFNDFTTIADIFEKEKDYQSAICFLEAELKNYEVFMQEEASYADRAYAGKAYTIASLYEKMGEEEKKKVWLEKAKTHAMKYRKNPSMEIESMKYCKGVKGRMIDNYGKILQILCEI